MRYLNKDYWKHIIKYKNYSFLEVLSLLLISTGGVSLATTFSFVPEENVIKAIVSIIIGFIILIKIKFFEKKD